MIELGKKIVRMAQKMGAEQAEAFITESESTSLSIEGGTIAFSSSNKTMGIAIRTVKDRKLGFSYCSDEKKLKETIERALASSKLSKQMEFNFPQPAKLPKVSNIDDNRVRRLSPKKAQDLAVGAINAANAIDQRILVAEGGIGYGWENFAIVNSNGVEAEESSTILGVGIYTVLRDGVNVSVGYESKTSRMKDIDFEAIGRKAGQMAKDGLNPQPLEGGRMPVLFDPHAFLGLIEFIVAPSVYGDATNKGETVYSNKLGERIFNESLSLVEDPLCPGGINSSTIDDEGAASSKTVVIEKGVLRNFLYDQKSALEAKKTTTANAVRCERLSPNRTHKGMPTVKGRNLRLEGPNTKLEELIKDTKEGILVHDLLGIHTSNPSSGDFSVNSTMAFKIKNGELAQPLKPLMLSGSLPALMMGEVTLANDYGMYSGHLSTVSAIIPTVRIANVNVTG